MDQLVIRGIAISESEQVDRLVSDAFGYHKPHRFFQDFPVWGSEQVHRFGIFKSDGKLISHVGLRITQLGGKPIGLVGAVATDALHRQQGLGSRLLEHTIEFARARNLDWLVLWGSEHDFYAKFGFDLVGIQTRISVGDFLSARPAPSARVQIQTGYTPQIFDTLMRESASQEGIKLTEADRPWFEKHETVQWLWSAEPFAFVGFERGMDLPHFVHEWGGDPTALPALLQQIHRRDPVAEILIHPTMIARLGLTPEIAHVNELLCLAKPLKGQSEWPDMWWISGLNAC